MKKRKYSVMEGQRFGALVAKKQIEAIALANPPRNGVYIWGCQCDCGGEIMVRSDDLSAGHVRSCNACSQDKYKEPELDDLTGKVFGDITVLEMIPTSVVVSHKIFWQPYYLVQCSCGRKFRTRQAVLIEGYRTACNVCDPR